MAVALETRRRDVNASFSFSARAEAAHDLTLKRRLLISLSHMCNPRMLWGWRASVLAWVAVVKGVVNQELVYGGGKTVYKTNT